MREKIALVVCWILCSCPPALAGENATSSSAPGHTVKSITPVFSQLVLFAYPAGFKPVFEKTNGGSYIQESVLAGETADRWSQMVTLTGARGLAANASVTPQSFLGGIAGRYKGHCPDTFSTKPLGTLKIAGYDNFVALASCGTVQSSGYTHSETALFIAVKGSGDYYTIQWAERGPAEAQPVDLNDVKWQDRLRKLSPIKICPRVPGEAPPYPSCSF